MLLRLSSVLAVAAAVLIAGCGGSKGPSSAGGSPHGSASVAAAYKFSACMRNHGVSTFPDPQVSSAGGGQSIRIQINPAISGSPDFRSAQKICMPLLGSAGKFNRPSPAQQQARTQALVGFAACMRRRGFAHFPDPSAQGQLSLQAIEAAGINLNEPAVRPAADACASASHGVITQTDVAQAFARALGTTTQAQTGG